MTRRSFPPYRADHVGSLLRPSYLRSAREEFSAGRLSTEALRETEDRAVREVVAMQEEIGLSTATDGEFRRSTWHMDFIYKLDGISASETTMSVRFHNEAGDIEFAPSATRVDGRIGLREPIFADDFAYLASQVSTATPKLTMPSPSMVHYRGGPAAISTEVYPDIEEFWNDLSAAYAEQIRALGARGCEYLQLDDTSLAYLNDPSQRAQLAERGDDAEHQHLRNIKQMNAALAARPAGMAVTTHMCRGNYRSSWVAEGGYDFVAEAVFNELDVDGFFLEFDDERSGGFAPLRFVPEDKVVVLGLVTTKRGELESKDELKRRIEEATRYIDIDQLCLSPQCGFASTEEGNALDHEQQVAKLRLIAETAEEVWGD
ncbi:5-methyltetrahydropteroyltriglutamate--homocysteine methyltransferase [Actinopolyspora xinjiangensis]|uniref:5-methyltetrahydropteroyltriglutamate--homocysteine methyltransferase n=1 Tax=Actinopolyspora xinjiangensis TaxID=405564 RepID=A0A1H0SJY0_9ACTN|nr:5-methyltetrahydropteroyltriglutamate--homocysteine S-methyltransferase [Actinopolyspora xinjiangensis]SDP41829.1 5-methyltetrahydropteroyltriglutamate--homocysteine methyltransferase [Actinopolyspora xinjiangensis]